MRWSPKENTSADEDENGHKYDINYSIQTVLNQNSSDNDVNMINECEDLRHKLDM